MNHETLHNTVRSRFKTQVADVQKLPTHYDNDGSFTPPENAPWARATVLDGISYQASLGSTRTFRTPGLLVVQLFTPWGNGDRKGLQLADAVRLVFLGVTVDGIRYRTPWVNPVGRVDDEWQINISCPFEVDDTVT